MISNYTNILIEKSKVNENMQIKDIIKESNVNQCAIIEKKSKYKANRIYVEI